MNVSRNPSDASEKSSSTAPCEEPLEPEKDRISVDRTSVDRLSLDRTSVERDDKRIEEEKTEDREERSSVDKEAEVDKEDKHK